jgi:hypothetical protein
MERAACLQGLYYISLKFLIKISLNKGFPSLKRPWKGVCPHAPQNGVPMETYAHFQSLN